MAERRVDLTVISPFLQEKILERYPHLHQTACYDNIDNNAIVILFPNLNKREITSYLESLESGLSEFDLYQLTDSSTGEYLRLRARGRIMEDKREIDSILREIFPTDE